MSESESKKICFIITPIGGDDQPIRRHIDGIIDESIAPALKDKFVIQVAHRMYDIGSINSKIISSVFNADLVIANLTSLNPNVMFELAIRYCFGKPAIAIAEKGTKLPFDVIDENTIFYINDPKGAADLRDSIIKFENNIDYTKTDYGSIYSAIGKIAIYNRVESDIKTEEVTPKDLIEFIKEKFDDLEKITLRNNVDHLPQLTENMIYLQLYFDVESICDEQRSRLLADLHNLGIYENALQIQGTNINHDGIMLSVFGKPSVNELKKTKEILKFILEKNNISNYSVG